ncbi:LexA repressor [Fusobacterium sp. DD29]|uniref:S24 family peptidase n=1 Tax=unclassified Fusobacterium TaxID=2648384 RepID=UPI001B8CA2FF|nr:MULTISPECIES: S24 family peptidase [unclassified Fusobacterium]MBR8749969.1 LexA repressor [Fusobacterium sp. DD29]MBR8762218.1 LexA repressor [Fusobacterium sp. DD25]MBR8768228.1 LexA repressor [Fusobacterium sp. DD43]MBR8772304.1 LexA repressor [Fusobacterium sp. DD40]MBR8776523.1 LexA repressor [Fusobacterium sp. DD17]
MEEQKEVAKYIENFMQKTQYKLEVIANMTGASLSSVGHYKTGKRTPKDDFIDKFIEVFNLDREESEKLKLAVALDRTPDEIKKKLESIPNIKKIDDSLIRIPVMAVASAGNGCLNFSESTKSIMIRKNGFDDNCYLIEVSGNSMEPLIQDGAYIVVDPREIDIVDGKIYVLDLDGQTYIKKVVKNEQLKMIILKSINPQYDDIYVTEEMLERFSIKGRAVKFILEGKL